MRKCSNAARGLTVMIAVLAVLSLASCCTVRRDASARFTFRGQVSVKGSEPHTYVGVTTEDGARTYAVYPEKKADTLRDLQGHLIEFVAVKTDAGAGEASLYLKDGTIEILSWKIVD